MSVSNIHRAMAIEGWMEIPDLEWLAAEAQAHQRIVEVGSWMGRSTRALADNTRGKIWAVDTWEGSVEHQSGLAEKPHGWLFDQFRENLKDHIASRRVVPVPLASVGAAQLFSGILNEPYFDMVFIDAEHSYESVRTDIEAWRPLVAPGGLLCGHDAGHAPVEQAVRAVFPNSHNEYSMWVVRL